MTRLFDARPFIIAEVGSNWRSLGDCLESIDVALACGADAVKFQAFSYEALYGIERVEFGKSVASDLLEREAPGEYPKRPFELPLAWLPKLSARAASVGLEFMCTAFSPELVAVVDPFVSVHKIASSDAAWPQLLDAVKATGKPALFSVGAKTNREIDEIEEILDDASKYVATYCVAAYPTDYVDLDAADCFDAFSDHTLGYTASVEMARRGAIAIEKHFTAFPDVATPDRPHSLTPAQFKRMVDLIRGRPVDSEESAMFRRHNRRLIATRDVAVGDVLRYGENYGAFRSLVDDEDAVSPLSWEIVEGKTALNPIARGRGVTLEDI